MTQKFREIILANGDVWELYDHGDPNFYTICKNKNWFAVVQFNGEMSVEQQTTALVKMCDSLRY